MTNAVDFAFWDRADEQFLADDRANPARAYAARLIAAEAERIAQIRVRWMPEMGNRLLVPRARALLLEVGPGMGFDYEDHFAPFVAGGWLSYEGLEGSRGLYDRLVQRYPGAQWAHGTFDDLQPKSCDIVYTKATFEHQPFLATPMRAFLAAARELAIINFYRPPAAVGSLADYDSCTNVWSITWRESDVVALIAEFGTHEVVHVPGSTNVLYVCRRRSA